MTEPDDAALERGEKKISTDSGSRGRVGGGGPGDFEFASVITLCIWEGKCSTSMIPSLEL